MSWGRVERGEYYKDSEDGRVLDRGWKVDLKDWHQCEVTEGGMEETKSLGSCLLRQDGGVDRGKHGHFEGG